MNELFHVTRRRPFYARLEQTMEFLVSERRKSAQLYFAPEAALFVVATIRHNSDRNTDGSIAAMRCDIGPSCMVLRALCAAAVWAGYAVAFVALILFLIGFLIPDKSVFAYLSTGLIFAVMLLIMLLICAYSFSLQTAYTIENLYFGNYPYLEEIKNA